MGAGASLDVSSATPMSASTQTAFDALPAAARAELITLMTCQPPRPSIEERLVSALEMALSQAVNAAASNPPPKKLLLVRHGQSTHNAATGDVGFGDSGADASLYDAPLSALGKWQAASLKRNAELASVELAVVSPLTRAIMTLLGAYRDREKRAK